MAYVVPRNRREPRPRYKPGHVPYTYPQLPLGKRLTESERTRLKGRGIDIDFLDNIVPDVIYVQMNLPNVPVPDTLVEVYKPTRVE